MDPTSMFLLTGQPKQQARMFGVSYLCGQVKCNPLYFLFVRLVPYGSFGCAWMRGQCINALALQPA